MKFFGNIKIPFPLFCKREVIKLRIHVLSVYCLVLYQERIFVIYVYLAYVSAPRVGPRNAQT